MNFKYLIWCISILIFFQFGCNNSISNPNIFKYNQAVGISSLDPAFSKDLATMWSCSHIYEGLFILDSNSEISKMLCDSFWTNTSQTSFTFHLKPAYFHRNKCFNTIDSTRKINAYDVQYSLTRLIDPKTASPGAWVLREKLDSIHPFTIIDSQTIQIHLRSPNAQFIQVLSMPYCSLIPYEAVEYYGHDFWKHPVGTGPFQFKLWEEGVALFLERNPNYHLQDNQGKTLPYLDMVKISFNENKKTEWLSFIQGELSMISGLDNILIQEIFDPNGAIKSKINQKYNFSIKPFLNTEYIAINMNSNPKSPLKNKQIRQAINHAINRQELAQFLKYNLVSPANKGFVSRGMPNFDTSFGGYEFNPSKAISLIHSAGYSLRNKPKIELNIDSRFIEMSEFLKNQLDKVGFESEIKLHPADMMMQLAVKGKIDLFRRSWMADYPDAENYLACFYSKNSTPPNYTRFNHFQYDKFYEASLKEMNDAKRAILYRKLEEIIIEESPIVPLYYDKTIRIYPKNISGLSQNVLNTLDLRRVRIFHKKEK